MIQKNRLINESIIYSKYLRINDEKKISFGEKVVR